MAVVVVVGLLRPVGRVPLATAASVRLLHTTSTRARQQGGSGDGGKGPSDEGGPSAGTTHGRGRRRRQRLTDRFFDIAAWQHRPSDKPLVPLLPSARLPRSAIIDVDPSTATHHHPFSVLNASFSSTRSRAGPSSAANNPHRRSAAQPGVSLQHAITLQEYIDTLQSMLANTNPRDMRRILDSFIIGQNSAKQSIATAVYNHYTRVYHNLLERHQSRSSDFPSKPSPSLDKSNILILGPSGSGKTLLARRIAEMLHVPFSMNDATTLTQAGYVGDDVDQCINRLLSAANIDVRKAEIGIVFIDEIDKISKRTDAGTGSTRDVAGEGVQQALLKMLEGTIVHCQDKTRGDKAEPVPVDTSNILFILSGAFVGLDKLIAKRGRGERGLGFGAKVAKPAHETQPDPYQVMSKVTEADLIDYGLIPEFVGRIPLVVSVDALTEDELVRILHEPKNSLLEQYRKLFSTWKVDLSIPPSALHKIAQRVMDRKTGARGLKFMMEDVLKEPMYLCPGSRVKSVTISDELEAIYDPPLPSEEIAQAREALQSTRAAAKETTTEPVKSTSFTVPGLALDRDL